MTTLTEAVVEQATLDWLAGGEMDGGVEWVSMAMGGRDASHIR